MTFQNKRLVSIIISVGCLLLIPLVTMQFSNEVNWKVTDFLVAGFLLLGAGLVSELVMRKITNKQTRLFIILGIITLLLLLWIELAVGIFGTPIARG